MTAERMKKKRVRKGEGKETLESVFVEYFRDHLEEKMVVDLLSGITRIMEDTPVLTIDDPDTFQSQE